MTKMIDFPYCKLPHNTSQAGIISFVCKSVVINGIPKNIAVQNKSNDSRIAGLQSLPPLCQCESLLPFQTLIILSGQMQWLSVVAGVEE